VQFQSPRFIGEPTLLAILNDPNTGTKKLQPGSPTSAVLPVQQALWDLGWTFRIHPPFEDHSQFVIGIYGPITTKTVLAYKTHHDLRFPPGDPNGFIDGLAGPTTLAHLDPDVVALDAATDAIAEKVAELQDDGTDVELVDLNPPTAWIRDTKGFMCPTVGPFGAGGGIWTEPTVGTFWLVRQTFDKYMGLGHAKSFLGFPITDTHFDDPHGEMERADFQHGGITFEIATGQVEVFHSV
jgi:hypothetical protein